MEAGGQDFLAAVVSLPGGRWANKLIGADAAMLAAAGLRSLPEQNIVQPGAQLLGFAVLQGWRLLSGAVPSDHAYGFVKINERLERRRSSFHVYLGHNVLCRCWLLQGIDMLPRWLRIRPELAVQELLSAPGLADALVRRSAGGRAICVMCRRSGASASRCIASGACCGGSRRSWRPPWCQVPA